MVFKGSLVQIFSATCVCLAFCIFKQIVSPYRLLDDDYFSVACDISLAVVFIFSLLLKFNELTDTVGEDGLNVLSIEQETKFGVNMTGLTVGLFGCVLTALMLLSLVAAQQIARAAAVPIIRLKNTRETPMLKLPAGFVWHLFLSQCVQPSNNRPQYAA